MLAQGASPGWQGIKTASAVGAALLELQPVSKDFNRAKQVLVFLLVSVGFVTE
jgi:hypothetical protein